MAVGIVIGFSMQFSVSFGDGKKSKYSDGCVQSTRGVHFHVKRSCIDKHRDNPRGAIKGLRVAQVVKDGKSIGYRVEGVETNRLAQKVGLKSGDTVMRVNGRKVTNLSSALRAYAGLSKRDTHTVVVNRNGKNRVLSYWIYR